MSFVKNSGKVDTSLLTVGGFQRKVNEKLKDCNTIKDAYEKAEEEYIEIFGMRKYKGGYESFRQMRHRWIKKK